MHKIGFFHLESKKLHLKTYHATSELQVSIRQILQTRGIVTVSTYLELWQCELRIQVRATCKLPPVIYVSFPSFVLQAFNCIHWVYPSLRKLRYIGLLHTSSFSEFSFSNYCTGSSQFFEFTLGMVCWIHIHLEQVGVSKVILSFINN